MIEKLKNAAWLHDQATQKIFEILDGENKKTRAVGGIVRDTIMGRNGEKTDIDFATEILPNEVMERAKKANIAYYPTGIEHGTITLRIGKKTFEVTTLRQDKKTDGRHAEVSFGTDWLVDAKRRDFTINALYLDMSGELFDPLNGLEDCLTFRVKFIGKADNRIKEDKLRVYRFFRFSASHGEQNFDAMGLRACKKFANDLGEISAERIGAEMLKILSLKQAAKTLKIMSGAGVFLLEEKILKQFFLYEEFCEYPKTTARLALISTQFTLNKLQKIWRLSNAQKGAISAYIKAADLVQKNQLNELVYRYADIKENIAPFAAALFGLQKQNMEKLSKKLSLLFAPPFPISGKDLMAKNFTPSPALGLELKKLEREWLKSDFKLTKDELLAQTLK